VSRDLRAIMRELADIDARLEHVAKDTKPDSDVSILAGSLSVIVDILRELAERTR
jgi:hypothetical protein